MSGGASNFVESVDSVFILAVAISVFFLVLITALMIIFIVKYNRKKNPRAVNVHGNPILEVTWTLIPTILVLILFWYGWIGYKKMVDIPKDAMTVEVTAQMWKWQFKYENGKTTDSLYVPVDKPVKLVLKSVDVNHAFFVPAFRIKKDVYPGTERLAWFVANEVGEYHIACAEYCGLNHSYMASSIIVMPKAKFNNWFSGMNDEDHELQKKLQGDSR